MNVRPSLRWWLIAGVLGLVLAGSAAVLGAYVSGRKAPPASGAAPGVASGPAAAAAASWIMDNVGPQHVVACDVAECGLLRAQGFPGTSLITVRAGISDVEDADVVVDTALLQQMSGGRLASVESPQPLAVFGTGPQAVSIATVTLIGSAQYGRRLAADLASRREAGAALVANPRLTLSPHAKTQLADGSVDTRICALLALLVGAHTIGVASFTAPGPGAGPAIASPGVVISTIDGLPAGGTGQGAVTLKSLIAAQQPPYQPLSVEQTVIPVAGADPGPTVSGAASGSPGIGPGTGTGTAVAKTATGPAIGTGTATAPGSGIKSGTGTGAGTPTGTSAGIGIGTASATGTGPLGLEILYAQPGPLGLLGGGSL